MMWRMLIANSEDKLKSQAEECKTPIMDQVNKEQAQRALDLGKLAYSEGKYAKALKCANTSNRLFPSTSATALAQMAIKRLNNQSEPSGSPSSASPSERGAGARGNIPPGATYTEEHLVHVRRVESCRTYYEMLNVKQDASEDELKVCSVWFSWGFPCSLFFSFAESLSQSVPQTSSG